MPERSAEYQIADEVERVLPALEESMADHGYDVFDLGEAAYDQIGDEDDLPYPPEIMTSEYGFNVPHLYIADADATQEDILVEGDFAAAVDVLYTVVATRDPSIEDDLLAWAESWEDAIELDEMDDPNNANRVIDRVPVLMAMGDQINDPC